MNNLNVLDKFNNIIINDLNNIIKTDEFSETIKNSMNIMNKMDIKYNGKNIQPISEKEREKEKEKIIDNDINVNQYSINVKKLYENCIITNLGTSNNSGDSYEKLIYLAMLSEQCSLYEDMFYFFKGLIKNRKKIINSDERNLFSISCKNVISIYRQAIRTIDAYKNKEQKKSNSTYLPYIKEYKNIVENVFYEKCQEIFTLIEEYIVNGPYFKDYDVEGKVFFYKMLGDYHRFACEYDALKTKEINQAKLYYNEGLKIATNLPITNPIYLRLILNTSEFYYEKKKAIELLNSTLEKFKKEEKNLDEEEDDVKDAKSIVNLMEENLELWESE